MPDQSPNNLSDNVKKRNSAEDGKCTSHCCQGIRLNLRVWVTQEVEPNDHRRERAPKEYDRKPFLIFSLMSRRRHFPHDVFEERCRLYLAIVRVNHTRNASCGSRLVDGVQCQRNISRWDV